MQSWSKMVKEYERSLAGVENQIKKLQQQRDKSRKGWEQYELGRKVAGLEMMQEDLHHTLAQIKDRSRAPK